MPSSHDDRASSGNEIQAPHGVFGQDNDNDAADSMTPLPLPPVNALQQMMQEHKKNWAEMTPDEILGVKTTGQDTDSLAATPDDTYHSPLEKFLMEKRLAQTGTTNLLESPRDGWNFLDKDTGLPNEQRVEDMRNGTIVRSQILDRWLQNAQDFNPSQNQDGDWARIFTAPQPEQQTVEQQADMAAFQHLLEPTVPSDAELKSAAQASILPAPDPDLNPQPVGYNPVGASYAPLVSGVGRPNGIAPLPTVTSGLQVPTAPASWAPQPPPWTVSGPQLYVNPVRKW